MGNEADRQAIAKQASARMRDLRSQDEAKLAEGEARRREVIGLVVNEASPEAIAERQQDSLDRLQDVGALDMFAGIAQGLEEFYPDVELRMDRPTGDPQDLMVIGIFFDFQDDGDGSGITYRQVYAAERDASGSSFVIRKGERRKDGSDIMGEPDRRTGHPEQMIFEYSYKDKRQLLADYVAAVVVGAINSSPQRVSLDVQRPFTLVPHASGEALAAS